MTLVVDSATSGQDKKSTQKQGPASLFQKRLLSLHGFKKQVMITNQGYSVNSQRHPQKGHLPFLPGDQGNHFLGTPEDRFPLLQERLNSLPVIIAGQARHLTLGFHLQGRVQVSAEVLP